MSEDRRRADDLESSLRQALGARASAVRAEPDLFDLARRISSSGERTARRGRLMVAAAVLVLAGAAGAGLGMLATPGRSPSAVFSADAADQGGSLPHGPSASRRRGAGATDEAQGAAVPVISRRAAGGVLLTATAALGAPVLLEQAARSSCYRYELVVARASLGATTAGGTAAVGLPPLGSTGIEVVASGSTPDGGATLWWAAVAVGDGVARVAAEQPGGGTDSMRPVDGLALLGGLAPGGAASRSFSVVAEAGGGAALGSIGFQLGWGARALGTASARSQGGCEAPPDLGPVRAAGPSSPLLATAGVVAAVSAAWGSDPAGLAANLAAVRVDGALRAAAEAAGGEPALSVGAAVSAVSFLSAREAEVAYELAGRWVTGLVVAAPAGTWRLSARSFCGALVEDGVVPAAPVTLLRACGAG